ncbi:MAG: prepilin-type N-terminal cleavage/methylation domain-containing protein [Planctomycetota bacterium]
MKPQVDQLQPETCAAHCRIVRPCRVRGGLTLIECMMATVVLAFATLAATTALSASYQQQAVAQEEAEATVLAEQLMSQVVSMRYEREATPSGPQPDWEERFGTPSMAANPQQEVRTRAVGKAKNLNNYTDAVVSRKGTYRRRIAVDPASITPGYTGLAESVGVATVEVIAPSGESVMIRRLLLPEN